MYRKKIIPAEYALLFSLLLNSFGVELQVKSDLGISCISSVSYVLSCIFPLLTFGTWNYLIQIFVLALLVLCTRRLKMGYLISVVLSVGFGTLLDVYAALIPAPTVPVAQIFCWGVGFFLTCFSIWMLTHCLLPILPFDTFARDMSAFYHLTFRRFKTSFDLTCLCVSVGLSVIFAGHLIGIGIGTVLSALFTGTLVSAIGKRMDPRFGFHIKYRPMRVFV